MSTTQTAAAATQKIKALRYGIEIETVGRGRKELVEAIAAALGGVVAHEGGYYDKWVAKLADGRKWTVMTDASLSAVNGVVGGAEVVSPILTFADDEMLQKVVRTLRNAGARVDPSCSIHVHVDGAEISAAAAACLLRLVYRRERQIQHALNVQQRRLESFCKGLDGGLIRRLDARRPATLDDLATVWYGDAYSPGRRSQHYDSSRYSGINLHSLWFRGTAEARWFEATLHAGKVRAYTLFARALIAVALVGTDFCDVRDSADASEAESFQRFLDAIGLGADEFENYREHLAGSLSTTIASAAQSLCAYEIQPPPAPTPIPVARPAVAAPRPVAAVHAVYGTNPCGEIASPPVPAMRLPNDDPREPNIGESLTARRRDGSRIAVTRLANGQYRVDSAGYGHESSVGTVYRSLSGAASAACGCRTNGYALFDRGEGEARSSRQSAAAQW